VPFWTTGYERLLAEPGIDAVINLTPIQLHAETNLAALQAGKHVYSEKPLAASLPDARRIQEEAGQRGLKLVAAPCVMLFPQMLYAQGLLQAGALGPVYSARGNGHGGVPPWHGYSSDPTQFFAAGGGPARDMGVYPLHALTGLLGPVQRVTAMSSRTRESFVVEDGPAQGKIVHLGEDDNWHILLDFGGGRLAHIAANNCVQGTRAPELEVFGLQGTVALSLIDVSAPVEVLRAGQGWEAVQLPQTGRAAGPDHLLGIEHLLDCIHHDRKPVLSGQHAVHVIEILEKAAVSAARGQTLAIESTF
jgi:predicted dehydrogenase